MWNERLIACARVYPSGVLTVVEDSGYPRSVRCVVQFDDARALILFPAPPPDVVGRQGLACLLFHRHNADMGGQRELLIKGELREEAGVLTLRPGDFLTGSGRQDTDRNAVRRVAVGHDPVLDAGAAQSARIPGEAREVLDSAP